MLIVGESSRAVLIDTALSRVVDTIEGWHFTVSPGLRWLIYTRFYPAATTVSTTDQLLYYDLQTGADGNRSKDSSGETVAGRILYPRYKGVLPPNTGTHSENEVGRANVGTWTEDGAGFLVAFNAKTPMLVLVDFSTDRPVVSTHEVSREEACEPNTLLPDADGHPGLDSAVLTRFSAGNFQIVAKYRYEWCRGRVVRLKSDDDFTPAKDH